MTVSLPELDKDSRNLICKLSAKQRLKTGKTACLFCVYSFFRAVMSWLLFNCSDCACNFCQFAHGFHTTFRMGLTTSYQSISSASWSIFRIAHTP